MYCHKHGIKKDYLYCLDIGCDDRFTCIECHVIDGKHYGHKHIIINEFIKNQQAEIESIFTKEYIQAMNRNTNAS